jgi:hypothetical protein
MRLGRTAHAGTELWEAKDDALGGWSRLLSPNGVVEG